MKHRPNKLASENELVGKSGLEQDESSRAYSYLY